LYLEDDEKHKEDLGANPFQVGEVDAKQTPSLNLLS